MDACSPAMSICADGLGAGVVVVPVSVPCDGEPDDPEDPEDPEPDGVLPEPLDGVGAGAGLGLVARGVALDEVDALRGAAPLDDVDGTTTFGSLLAPDPVVVVVVGVVPVAAGGAVVAAGGAAATTGAAVVAVPAPGSSLSAA
jgi:hypothetical protein